MKCLGIVCLLLLSVIVIPSSARRGKKHRGSTYTYNKHKSYPNVDYRPSNRRGYQGVTCSDAIEYVCGNDGKTYRNFCTLMKAMCTSTCLKFAAYGRCRENGPRGCARCSTSVYWPYYRNAYQVCGTDGVTYDTTCDLCRRKCLTMNDELDVEHKGSCEPLPTPSKDKIPKFTTTDNPTTTTAVPTTVAMTTPCRTDCPLSVETVCGNDGQTYPSPCVLLAVKCTTSPGLSIASEGPCRGDV